MKETTLEHVVNSLKGSFLKGKPAFSFAHPFSDVCFKVLSSSENVCIYSTTSITVLNKDALLAELIKITGIGEQEQAKDNPTDPINPTHYNGTQTLDRMIAVFGVDAVISFCEINAFKYRMRAGKKDGNPIEQDIKKALWYEDKAEELKNNP